MKEVLTGVEKGWCLQERPMIDAEPTRELFSIRWWYNILFEAHIRLLSKAQLQNQKSIDM